MNRSKRAASFALAALVIALGCSKPAEQPQQATSSPGANPAASAPAATGTPAAARPAGGEKTSGARTGTPAGIVTIPAGTELTVRLDSAVGSKISTEGQEFTGTVAEPVTVGGGVVIPQGATAKGVVAEAKPLGRFKGGARLRLTLQSVTINGANYPAQASVSRVAKGKGKRTGVMIGGGAGLGALIGGLAGGGKGAAIGAAAGAGAGTAGAAFTGNKDIVLPAETALGFKLAEPVEVKK
jgi:hypothetical protein